MGKLNQKISPVGPGKMPTTGPHNPNVGTHGSGIAPKPKFASPVDKGSAPSQAGMARVQGTGTGNPQGRLPVQNPPANVVGSKIGQSLPNTAPVASKKPNRKGGAAFFGER